MTYAVNMEYAICKLCEGVAWRSIRHGWVHEYGMRDGEDHEPLLYLIEEEPW